MRTLPSAVHFVRHRLRVPTAYLATDLSRRLATSADAATAPAALPAVRSGPLAGIRVLDLSRILAGPYCSQVLCDYGADVIKIEHPVSGDDTRTWGPPFTAKGRMSAYFLSVNRGKRSVCINLKAERGKQLIRRLAEQCDVLLENFIPGKVSRALRFSSACSIRQCGRSLLSPTDRPAADATLVLCCLQMDELGLSYASLSSLHPGLIYASLSAYGTRGPLASSPGYDVMVAAQGGLLHITGHEEQPAKPGVAFTDLTTGLYLHGAILAALLQRHSTGRGQHIHTSLYQAQVAALSMVMQNQLVQPSWRAQRWGTAHSSIVPYQAFLCSDNEWIVAGALSDSQWAMLQRLMQLEPPDERFRHNSGRVQHRDELIAHLTAAFASQSSEHWLAALNAQRLPCAPVLPPDQVINSEQVRALGMRVETEQALDGRVEVVAPPIEMSESEVRVKCGAPVLGQHTAAVLRDMCGVEEDELQQLEQQGVVRRWLPDSGEVGNDVSHTNG